MRKKFRKVKGFDGTREQLKQQDQHLTSKILESLQKKSRQEIEDEISTALEGNSEKSDEQPEFSEMQSDYMPLLDNELIITGHHIQLPNNLAYISFFEEAPMEFK